MFLDWYSKNALVIQLLIVLGVKEHREGRGGGGRVERVNKFLVPKKGGRERGAYLKVGLNRGYIRYILLVYTMYSKIFANVTSVKITCFKDSVTALVHNIPTYTKPCFQFSIDTSLSRHFHWSKGCLFTKGVSVMFMSVPAAWFFQVTFCLQIIFSYLAYLI